MNYRQWKKNYKKKHGYNPPISEDRRKRNRRLARTLPPVIIDEFMPDLLNTLADAFNALSNSFANVAKRYEWMAEDISKSCVGAGESFKCAAENVRNKAYGSRREI